MGVEQPPDSGEAAMVLVQVEGTPTSQGMFVSTRLGLGKKATTARQTCNVCGEEGRGGEMKRKRGGRVSVKGE